MGDKSKFIIIGLIGAIFIFVFISLNQMTEKQKLEAEIERFQRETATLEQKVQEKIEENLACSLAAKGVTVFVTTHYMDEALNCDRIVMINEGKIVAIGSAGEIIAKTCPGEPKATLNDAFIRLMTRTDRVQDEEIQNPEA